MAKQAYKVYESNQKYMMVVIFQYAKVMSMNISFKKKSNYSKNNKFNNKTNRKTTK